MSSSASRNLFQRSRVSFQQFARRTARLSECFSRSTRWPPRRGGPSSIENRYDAVAIKFKGHHIGCIDITCISFNTFIDKVNFKIYVSFLIHIYWSIWLRRSRRLKRPSTTLTRTTTASSPRQSFEKSSIVSAKRSGIQMCSRESGS